MGKSLDLDAWGGLFVVKGNIAELHVETGAQNLLAKVDRHYKSTSLLAGIGAGAGELFGQVANAASLAMYDGEDTQNFLCLLDGQVMCGQFGGAEWLMNGRHVKVVAERREGVMRAHGILDEERGLLWIGHPWGRHAEAKANWRIAGWSYAFSLCCWTIAHFIGVTSISYIESISYGAFYAALICAGVALWANRGMQALSGSSTEIFRLLGFARPESVNLNRYRISAIAASDYIKYMNSEKHEVLEKSSHQTRDVYCYKKAIADGSLTLAKG